MPGNSCPFPPDEAERLRVLSRYKLLDTPPEPLFDGVAQLAALVTGAPMAVVTLIDKDRQWFKARIGLELSETPRSSAFCAHAILSRGLLVIEDAASDPRFKDNPLVTSPPGVRFYAGAPLITPDNFAIGTIAVFDRHPRSLSAEQRRGLSLLAEHVVDHLEASRREQDSMHILKAIVDASPLAIMALDLDGKVVLWNESSQALFGFTESEMLGQISRIVPNSEQESFRHVMSTVLSGKVIRDFAGKRQRKNGALLDVSISAAPIRDRDGKVIGLMSVLADISERQRAHADLQHSLSLLRATLESTADGILAVDLNGRIIGFNERVLEMWRIPREVVESGDTNKVVEKAAEQLRDPEHFLTKIRRYIAGEDLESWDTLRFKDGRLFERFSHLQVVNGKPVGRVFSYRDITRRVQLEEQLRQAQKMEAIGQLAGGIAHDFNNLLNVIVGYSALMQSQISPEDPLYRHSEQVLKAADRAAALTRQLLVFSRRQVLELHVLDLNAIISGLGKMLPRIIGEDIQLELQLAADVGNVKADAGQIEQVVMNLVVNGRDAMPKGGKLFIKTEDARVDRSNNGSQLVPPGEYVNISVSDTGIGMTREVQAHIFEPFFTTKEPGKGTGLGLATVYGIVHQLGGNIDVRSELGVGSTFIVSLPRHAGPVENDRSAASSGKAMKGSETVLVVEDETSLRELIAQILESCGYRVISARDGSEAIRHATQHEEAIDLVVTDVVMPGMRGWELAERMKDIRPTTPVLYISGYADDELIDRSHIASGAAFLQKPFTPETLARKVREVLSVRTRI